MSRDGSGVYSKPGGTTAVTGTPVSSSAYNTAWDDLVTDLNTARPISSGGTGATTASGARTNLGVSATDATITAIAALDFSVAGSMLYSTAADTFSLVTSTAAGRALLDDADAAAQRTTLGLVIGTNVQAYDADLTTWAGLTPSAYFQTLVDDADAATARTTLGFSTLTDYVTLTDSQTMTNKTLTSPTINGATLSGTINGTPTITGNLLFSGSPRFAALHIGADTDIYLYESSANVLTLKAGGTGTETYLNLGASGYAQINGDDIITANNTKTIANKTLSSPTLSGTVAGSPTASGAWTFSGNLITVLRSGTAPTAAGDESFRVISTGGTGFNAAIGIVSGNAATARILFGDSDDVDIGYVSYNNINNSLTLGTNNTDSLTISSSGAVAASGAISSAGVAIPTISSTDTLSNKTLSSPTLSGTVAGSPTFSGTVAFGDANLNIQLSAGVGYLVYDSNDYIEYNRSANQFAMRVGNAAIFTVSASAIAGTPSITAMSGTAIPAGGTAGAGLMVSSTANFGVFFGSGAPTLSAAKGSLYMRSDGSTTNDRMYVNTNGSTTWTAVTTAA